MKNEFINVVKSAVVILVLYGVGSVFLLVGSGSIGDLIAIDTVTSVIIFLAMCYVYLNTLSDLKVVARDAVAPITKKLKLTGHEDLILNGVYIAILCISIVFVMPFLTVIEPTLANIVFTFIVLTVVLYVLQVSTRIDVGELKGLKEKGKKK